MRCDQCNKFVSLDAEQEPEINASVDGEGNITGDARIVNTCAECGQELSEATLDIEFDLSDEVAAHREEHADEKGEHDALELDDDGGSRIDEYATVDRRGKPIKNPRYRKHFYGVEVEFTLTCQCGETFSGTWSDKVQASGMESLV